MDRTSHSPGSQMKLERNMHNKHSAFKSLFGMLGRCDSILNTPWLQWISVKFSKSLGYDRWQIWRDIISIFLNPQWQAFQLCYTVVKIWQLNQDARRIIAAEMKYMRKPAGCTWTDYKPNTDTAKELNITPVFEKI